MVAARELGWMMKLAANSTVFRILVIIFKLNRLNFVIQHLLRVLILKYLFIIFKNIIVYVM